MSHVVRYGLNSEFLPLNQFLPLRFVPSLIKPRKIFCLVLRRGIFVSADTDCSTGSGPSGECVVSASLSALSTIFSPSSPIGLYSLSEFFRVPGDSISVSTLLPLLSLKRVGGGGGQCLAVETSDSASGVVKNNSSSFPTS